MSWILWLQFLFLSLPFSQAEYRAYELLLTSADGSEQTALISTMDHIQYPGYHYIPPGARLEYVDSWMCRGDTSNFKAICEKPPRRDLASEPPPPPETSEPTP